jgi:hypothetical protein
LRLTGASRELVCGPDRVAVFDPRGFARRDPRPCIIAPSCTLLAWPNDSLLVGHGVADLQLVHQEQSDAGFLILTKLSSSVQSRVARYACCIFT